MTDYKRFIAKTAVTSDGEIASKKLYAIDEAAIAKEAKYDGFYADYQILTETMMKKICKKAEMKN